VAAVVFCRAMPVEVVPFCHSHTLRKLLALPSIRGCRAKLRTNPDESLYVTDNQNYIVDLYFSEPIADLQRASSDILNVVGVVEHGLFLGMANVVIVAGSNGIEIKEAPRPNGEEA
jgi:ribose 5-phosphate isomerase A